MDILGARITLDEPIPKPPKTANEWEALLRRVKTEDRSGMMELLPNDDVRMTYLKKTVEVYVERESSYDEADMLDMEFGEETDQMRPALFKMANVNNGRYMRRKCGPYSKSADRLSRLVALVQVHSERGKPVEWLPVTREWNRRHPDDQQSVRTLRREYYRAREYLAAKVAQELIAKLQPTEEDTTRAALLPPPADSYRYSYYFGQRDDTDDPYPEYHAQVQDNSTNICMTEWNIRHPDRFKKKGMYDCVRLKEDPALRAEYETWIGEYEAEINHERSQEFMARNEAARESFENTKLWEEQRVLEEWEGWFNPPIPLVSHNCEQLPRENRPDQTQPKLLRYSRRHKFRL